MLEVFPHKLDTWVQLSSVGLSVGILVGCDSAKVIVENTIIESFSITLM